MREFCRESRQHYLFIYLSILNNNSGAQFCFVVRGEFIYEQGCDETELGSFCPDTTMQKGVGWQQQQPSAPPPPMYQTQMAAQGVPIGADSFTMQAPPSQVMSDVLEEYIPLPEISFDVTNQLESFCLCIHCPFLGWLSKKLKLEDQEAVFTQKLLCCKSVKRMPYAQLGNVMIMRTCCGCVAVGSELAPLQHDGKGGMSPGCGCDEYMCKKIENELQQRKLLRGNVAQVNKLEHLGNKIGEVSYGVDALMAKNNMPNEQEQSINSGLQNFYGNKTFNDLACCCEMLCCTSHYLVLDKEEAIHYHSDCCTSRVAKREYAQLGFVKRRKDCFCCRTVASEVGDFTPGCGCNRSLVNEIVEELQARKIERGTVGQIREQERLLGKLRRINYKMDQLEMNLGVAYPPDVQTMQRIFAGATTGVPAVPPRAKGALDGKEEHFTNKSFITTNTCAWLCSCCCLRTSIELLEDEYHEHEKDCCDDSIMKVPYGQMQSVDYNRYCCCYEVNGLCPGCCCNGSKVEEIAHEMQERKIKRGNIMQLKQLEAFQSTAQELDLRMHLYLDKYGISYPPTDPQVISEVYGMPVFRILSQPFGLLHPDASQAFEYKDYGNIMNFWECCCCFLCCLGPQSRRLEMLDEEIYITNEGTCFREAKRKPYAQLGDVEKQNCCCCVQVDDVGSPGCGCNSALVDQIAHDLQVRKVLRGNIAQLKVSENIMKEVLKINAKLRLLHYKLR